jgi:8-oxo-dGTP diphosphatase
VHVEDIPRLTTSTPTKVIVKISGEKRNSSRGK